MLCPPSELHHIPILKTLYPIRALLTIEIEGWYREVPIHGSKGQMEPKMENHGNKVFLGNGVLLAPDETSKLVDEIGEPASFAKYALLVPFRSDLLSCVEDGSMNEPAMLETKSAPDESFIATLALHFGRFAMRIAIPLVDAVALEWLAEATKNKRAMVLMEVPETHKLGILHVRVGKQRVSISQGCNSEGASANEGTRLQLLGKFLEDEMNEVMSEEGSGLKAEHGAMFVCVSRAMLRASTSNLQGQGRIH